MGTAILDAIGNDVAGSGPPESTPRQASHAELAALATADSPQLRGHGGPLLERSVSACGVPGFAVPKLPCSEAKVSSAGLPALAGRRSSSSRHGPSPIKEWMEGAGPRFGSPSHEALFSSTRRRAVPRTPRPPYEKDCQRGAHGQWLVGSGCADGAALAATRSAARLKDQEGGLKPWAGRAAAAHPGMGCGRQGPITTL